MKFFVFSYNRGEYLRNCVTSIARCSPDSEIIVYDDDSHDEETRRVLSQLAEQHTIISSREDEGNKHGGLYANMQRAYESLSDQDLVCFLQDDCQLVRQLTNQDRASIASRFHENPSLGFISPAFIRGISRYKRGSGKFRFDDQQALFFLEQTSRSAGSHYSDIFVTLAGRLKDNGWSFRSGEPANQQQAMEKFSGMGYLPTPFAMWLPYGTAYRGKKRTLALKLAEKYRSCGFYPFYYLTQEEVSHIASSCPPELPIAEQFLNNSNPYLRKPWIYNPLQGSSWLKHLNNVETFFGRR